MKRGLYIGRFQPFHKGHLYVVKKALEEVDELIIGIGSTQANYDIENPFTCGERMEMIRITLDAEGIESRQYWLVPIPDIHNNIVWVSHVLSLCPRFDIVYGGNLHTLLLFESSGLKTKRIPLLKPELFSGTEIRRRILHDEPWEDLVPPAVARFIKEIGGIRRLKILAEAHRMERNKIRATRI